VIVTTARSTVGDKILGLNVGADDYLAKPFDLDELEARVRALVRRSQTAGAPRAAVGLPQLVGTLSFDETTNSAQVDGRHLELSPRETALVRALMQRPGQAVSKERLFDAVFNGDPDVALDAVEVVAYRVRKKLKEVHCNTQIVTLRGLGYLLQDRAGQS
jgi:two-component system, OmpR family, response regulator TctD